MGLKDTLIFALEVDAASFAQTLKDAVTKAVANLTPQLTVRSADIKFVGKVKAVDLFDFSGLSEAFKAAMGGVKLPGGSSTPSLSGRLGVSGGASRGAGDVVAKSVTTQNELTQAVIKTAAEEKKLGLAIDETLAKLQKKAFVGQAKAALKDIAKQEKLDVSSQAKIDNAHGRAIEENKRREAQAIKENIALAREAAAEQAKIDNAHGRAIEENKRRQARIDKLPVFPPPVLPKSNDVANVLKSNAFAPKQVSQAVNNNLGAFRAGNDVLAFLQKAIPLSNTLRSALNAALNPRPNGSVVTNFLGGLFKSIGSLSAQAGGAFVNTFKFIGNSINNVKNIALTAISPFTNLFTAIAKSTAILTGTGLIFGGFASIPIAAIRLATDAFQQLAKFADGVSESVVQFSGELAKVHGAERIELINEKFNEFKKTVLDTSITFGLTSSTVSRGLAELLSAGVGVSSVTERMSALNTAARVAVGGFTTLESSFKGVLAISKAFNTSFEQAGDQLFAIQRLGIAPIRDLAPALGRVASVAAEAGARSEDLGAAISAITAESVPLDQAITGLRQFFAELSAGGTRGIQNVVKQVRELTGIKLSFDANTLKAPGGLETFLKQLNEVRKIDPELVARLFPSTREIVALLPLLNNINQFSRDRIQILHSEGEAQAASEARLNTIAGSFDRLKVAVENSVVVIADQIAKLIGLKNTVDGVISKMQAFIELLGTINPIDLKQFVTDLFTSTQGLKALAAESLKIFGPIVDAALEVTAPILQVFAFIAREIEILLQNAVIKGLSATVGAISQSVRPKSTKTTFEKVINLVTGGPFNAIQNATEAAPEILRNSLASTLDDFSKNLEGGIIDAASAINLGTEFAKNADFSDLTKKLRASVKDIGGDIFKNLLDKNTTIDQRIAGLRASSIGSQELRSTISSLNKELARELDQGLPSIGSGVSRKIADGFEKIKAIDLAKLIIGKSDEDIVARASKSASDLAQAFNKIGIKTDIGQLLNIGQANERLNAVSKAIGNIFDRLNQLRNANNKPGISQDRIEGNNLEISILQKKIRALGEERENLKSTIADFPDINELLEKFGIKTDSKSIVEQFILVDKELEKVKAKFASGTSTITDEQFVALDQLRDFFANTIVRLSATVDLAPGEKEKLLSALDDVAKNAGKNFNTVFSKLFEVKFLPLTNTPFFNLRKDINQIDLNTLRRQAKEAAAQIDGVAIGIAKIEPNSPQASIFEKLKNQFFGLMKVANATKAAIQDSLNPDLGNNDSITFFVADAQDSLRAFLDAMKTTLKDVGDAVKSIGGSIDQVKDSVGASGGGGLGGGVNSGGNTGRQIDARVQTFVVTPRQYVESVLGKKFGRNPEISK